MGARQGMCVKITQVALQYKASFLCSAHCTPHQRRGAYTQCHFHHCDRSEVTQWTLVAESGLEPKSPQYQSNTTLALINVDVIKRFVSTISVQTKQSMEV